MSVSNDCESERQTTTTWALRKVLKRERGHGGVANGGEECNFAMGSTLTTQVRG